jgi:hypothetical protein
MTPQELDAAKRSINELFEVVRQKLDHLAGRWQDESEYEDFNDYITQMKSWVPTGWTWVGGQKRPFGFKAKMPSGHKVLFYANSRSVGWRVVK